jgi:hypothetical protein
MNMKKATLYRGTLQAVSEEDPSRAASVGLQDLTPLLICELTALRTCVNRHQPFEAEEWQARIAAALGLESTLRRRGRQ